MKKLKIVLTTVPMCLGLAVAQDAPSAHRTTNETATVGNTGQTWVGILVDSKCTSSGSSADVMPQSTASSVDAKSGMPRTSADQDSMMNRSTPLQAGRTSKTTDNDPSQNAAGTGSTAGNSGASNSKKTPRSTDMARTTAQGTAERSVNSPKDGSYDSKATPQSSDMNQNTPAGSARGTDSRNGNNDRNSGTPSDVAAVGRASTMGSANWDRTCFISPTSSSFVLKLQDGRTVKIDDAGNSRISSQLQSTGRVSSMNKVFRVKVTGSVEGDTIHISDIQM